MKCMSCDMEINPKWRHAIDSNICPFCGSSVLPEKMKEAFSSLREIMDELQEYPDQLNDWMLSNHNYIKTDSSNLINYVSREDVQNLKRSKDEIDFERKKFTVKVKNESGEEEEIQAEKALSEERTASFFKRAEAVKPNIEGFQTATEKTQYLKKMAQQIKKSGGISVPAMSEADPDDVAEMEAALSGEDYISSSLTSSDDDIPPYIEAALQRASQSKGSSTQNAADLLKLQRMQDRVATSKTAFESGENRGKNGFSRSG